ncbi:hypothetical protein R1flu_001159 [Riccia fluitans]|uniref:Ankyrin repeat protein n=1 Tax=Riccia fluitans TaxID=41844 RepID=A0ABD1Y2G9_9MARC
MELDVKQILDAGVDVSDFDSKGLTPLMHAALNGHSSVLNTLLEARAPWNALDPSGRCAGDYALEDDHQDAIEVLLNAGIRAELIFGAVERPCRKKGDAKNKVYLEERAEFSEGRLMDEKSNAVLMEWENPLMAVHAKVVCSGGGDILNIGFGMGLVDTGIQSHDISSLTTIEAHPDVYAT